MSVSASVKIPRWYADDCEKRHEALAKTVEHITSMDRARIAKMREHMRLYCADVSGTGANLIKNLFNRPTSQLNLIRQAVDTLASRISQQRPKPQYIVTDGSFDLEQVARLRTRVLEGQLYDCGGYEVMPQALVDALVLGTGHVVGYLDEETGQPQIERCMPGEILVDPRDAATGKPRCVYRNRAMSRDVIRDLFPDVSDARLSQARSPNDAERAALFLPADRTVDEVMVTEAWYAPPGVDKTGGRHVIALSSCTLLDEEWDHMIPVVPIYAWKRQTGYWGVGVAELGEASQECLDRLLQNIEYVQRKGSTVWVLCDRRAEIRVERLTNEPLSIVKYTGTGNPPVIQTFNATPDDWIQEIDRIRERFMSMLGVSQMAAENRVPAGITGSGAAQRTYEDISSQRHAPQARQYEDAFMQLVEVLEALNEHAQANDESYSVMARTQRGLVPLVRQVKWSDARMDKEQYRLTCFPTSQLPTTVPGRLAALQEWVASGFVSRPYAQKQLIDLPDDDMQRLELADLDFVMWQIEEILNGKVVSPEAYQNLEMSADTARRAYLQVKSRGAPEQILETLRNFIDDCMDQVKDAQAKAAAEAQASAAPPMGPAAQPAQGPMPGAMPEVLSA